MTPLENAREEVDLYRRALLRRITGSIATSEDVTNLIQAIRTLNAEIVSEEAQQWDGMTKRLLVDLSRRIEG